MARRRLKIIAGELLSPRRRAYWVHAHGGATPSARGERVDATSLDKESDASADEDATSSGPLTLNEADADTRHRFVRAQFNISPKL